MVRVVLSKMKVLLVQLILLLGVFCFVSATIPLKDNVLYVWAGDGDQHDNDFLATFSISYDSFGLLLATTSVPTSGNEPHHLGISTTNNLLGAGGLLSLLKGQDGIFFFDISDKRNPKYIKSTHMSRSAITDEFRPRPGGGFLITNMGSASGGAPGAVAEIDGNLNIVGEYPQGATDTSVPGFNPHGISLNLQANLFVTSDYVLPGSTLNPTAGPVFRNTVRIWNYARRSIIRTVTLEGALGIMDVLFVPNDPLNRIVCADMSTSTIYLINPADGSYKPFYTFGYGTVVSMLLTFSADGHYLYVSLTMENRVAVLRVTDINNPVRVDDPNSNQPFGGPHYITLTPDGSHLVVSDYFLQEGTEGVVNPPADYMVWVVPIFRNGPNVGGLDVAHARSIDFKTRFTSGVAHPHGVKVVYEPTPDACLREGHH